MGNEELIDHKVKRRRLEWLGHIAHMPDHRIPKQVFFGFLKQPHPQGGPKRRWKDVIRKDLKDLGVDEDKWYNEAVTSREGWRALWRRKTDRIPSGQAAELPQTEIYALCF